MKNPRLLCFMLLLCPILTFGQGVFSRRLKVSTVVGEYIHDIEGASDGGLYMLYTQNNVTGICKTDHLGQMQWSKEINSSATRMELAADGSIYTASANTLSKFSPAGSPIWAVNLSFAMTAFDVAPDGEIFCTGDNKACKLDANGTVIWGKTISAIHHTNDIVASASGGAYIAASAQSSQFEYRRGTLISLSDAGSVNWARQAQAAFLDFRKLVETPDLQVTVAANESGNFIATNTLRFDPAGNPLWNTISGPARTTDIVTGMTATSDNSVAIIGVSSSAPQSFFTKDIFVYWISSTGTTATHFINMQYGLNGAQIPMQGAITTTPDGLLAYAYAEDQGTAAPRKAWFGKLNTTGATCKTRESGSAIAWSAVTNPYTVTASNATFSATVTTATATASGLLEELLCNNCPLPATAAFSSSVNALAATFTNTSTQAGTYTWDFGDGSSSTAANPSHTYAMAGSYTVCLTATGACDQNVVCATVDVCTNLNPALGPDQALCPGAATTLSPGAGFSTYLWSTGSTASAITVGTPGTYSVTVTDGQGCTASDNLVLSNHPAPNVSIGANQAICAGSSATFDAGPGFTSYLWSTAATTQSITATTAATYSVTVTDANGCTGSASAALTVNANPAPSITASGPTTFCAGGSVGLNAGAGFASYLWSTAATTQSITATTGGTYTVTVTDANGCSGSASLSVTVNPLPSVAITATNDGNICFGAAVTLTATPGHATYAWSGGGTTNTKVASTAGTYTVTVTNTAGCVSLASYTVTSITVCAVPTGLSASSITASSAVLNWPAVPCATSYTIQYRRSGTNSWTSTTATTNSKLITGLQANTTYQWRLKSTCSGGGGGNNYSVIATFTTSAMKMAQASIEQKAPIIYPNPNAGAFTLEFDASAHEQVQIAVHDMFGKRIQTELRTATEGNNVWEMQCGHLAKGIYIVTIVAKDKTQGLRFMVE